MRKQAQFLNRVARTAVFLLTVACVGAPPLPAQAVQTSSLRPTAIVGESWLTHLQRSFNETSMGKTGRLGPPAGADPTAGAGRMMTGAEFAPVQVQYAFDLQRQPSERGTVVLRGSDLYRINCRGCHGESGTGAPPEINSVINPVRATSAATVMERMKASGMEMSRADATKLARQSKALLVDRIHHGGQDMPAFPHLSEAEVKSLVAYLRELAGVPGAEAEQLAVHEERARVGEHIAKSTCHICHSAAGPNPTARQLYDGAIPPLSTLPLRTTRAEFIRKVTRGAPIMMGAPPQWLRGRMPVFYYLSEEEAADIYLYLTSYPPTQGTVLEAAITNPSLRTDAEKRQARPTPASSSAPAVGPDRAETRTTPASSQMKLPLLGALLVALLLGLGLAFTAYEVRRLLAKNKRVTRLENAKEAALMEETDMQDANRELGPEVAA